MHKEEAEQSVHKKAEHHQVEEQQRVEVERCRAKKQARKHVSHFLAHYDEADSSRQRRLLCNSMARAR